MRRWPVLVACLALVALAASQTLPECTEDDIVETYTPCVDNLRSVVFYYAIPCVPNGLELPTTIANLPCDIACDDGEFLPLGRTSCSPCVPGTYSIGGGDVYDDWLMMPTEFVTECTHSSWTNRECMGMRALLAPFLACTLSPSLRADSLARQGHIHGFGQQPQREQPHIQPSPQRRGACCARYYRARVCTAHTRARARCQFVAPSHNKIRFRYKVDAELNYDGYALIAGSLARWQKFGFEF